ncbi:MAG: hypothetical protein RIQ81_1575 [Pseudomonadota bacterium]|jgi:Xaa-Pro aminopeptidase
MTINTEESRRQNSSPGLESDATQLDSADYRSLHRARMRKVQKAMREHDIPAILLTNPVNIRFATGVSVMPIWTAINFARYALVPQEGDPVIFEYGKSLHVARSLWPGSQPAKYFQYRFTQHEAVSRSDEWARELVETMQGLGLRGTSAGGAYTLGFDALDHYGHAALEKAGVTLVDADQCIVEAKLLKSADEIKLLRESCGIAEAALHKMAAAIAPGISEQELFGIFFGKAVEMGAEYSSTRLLSAGRRTNPWFNEVSSYKLRPGDLIGIDTDMTGPEGYLCDISRTFVCGEEMNKLQQEVYSVARDFIYGVIEQCRPGVSYESLVRNAPVVPEKYRPQAYSCMIHGSGFDDEPPYLPYLHQFQDGALMPRGELQENMVLSVEFYAGEKGARDGVKLEEQILITASGSQLLSHFPI